MEGFIINIIATSGFSVGFLIVFFSIYYFYLKGTGGDKDKDKNKKLRKRILK